MILIVCSISSISSADLFVESLSPLDDLRGDLTLARVKLCKFARDSASSSWRARAALITIRACRIASSSPGPRKAWQKLDVARLQWLVPTAIGIWSPCAEMKTMGIACPIRASSRCQIQPAHARHGAPRGPGTTGRPCCAVQNSCGERTLHIRRHCPIREACEGPANRDCRHQRRNNGSSMSLHLVRRPSERQPELECHSRPSVGTAQIWPAWASICAADG